MPQKDDDAPRDEFHAMIRSDERTVEFLTDGVWSLDAKQLTALEQADRLGPVIENCVTGIYLFDARTLRFIQANGSIRQRLGYSMAELRTMTPLDINDFASRETFEALLAPLLAHKAPSVAFETVNRRKDGNRYPVEVHYELSETSRGAVVIAFSVDISEKKQREGELAASRALNAAILNSVSDGIASLTPIRENGAVVDFTVATANRAARQLFAHLERPLVGAPLTAILPELERAELFPGLVGTMTTGTPFEAEVGPVATTADWYLVRAMRTTDAGLTLTLVNITDAKARELDLRQSNAALRQFSAIVSHDLQAPLRHIGLFTEMLQARIEPGDEEAAFLAGRVRENVARMQRMIRSLMDYTAVAYRQIRYLPVDLNKVMGEVLRLLEGDIAEGHARIKVAQLPVIKGDPDLLQRLLQNLLSNALKYRRPEAAPCITVGVRRRKDSWEISVTDNGIGIDPRHGERIFEVFARLHRDEKTYDGLGIGLALCRQIVESHKGRIWLDIQHRGGARFCFSLPAG